MALIRYLVFLVLFGQAQAADLTTFHTRPALVEDIDTIYNLICDLAIFEGKDITKLPVTKENLKKYGFSEKPYFHVELAQNQNGIVGYALYPYVYSGHQGTPFLYVEDLYVKPNERGQGLGSGLLKTTSLLCKRSRVLPDGMILLLFSGGKELVKLQNSNIFRGFYESCKKLRQRASDQCNSTSIIQ